MGYFRIFYYIAYTFNFITRMLKKHGKQILWVAGIFVFLCLCMYNPKSSAIYIGDYSYGDPNYAVEQAYKKVSLDFLKRLDSATDNTIKQGLIERLKSNRYCFYVYYGTSNATDMISGQNYNLANMRVFVYSISTIGSSNLISPSSYDDYLGIDPVSILELNCSDYYFNKR